MLERELEKIFTKEIKRAGGKAYKFTSPGNSGVPDRIVILPKGKVIFVEMKTSTGHTTPNQDAQISKLRDLGCHVDIVRGEKGAMEWFEENGLHDAAERMRKRL